MTCRDFVRAPARIPTKTAAAALPLRVPTAGWRNGLAAPSQRTVPHTARKVPAPTTDRTRTWTPGDKRAPRGADCSARSTAPAAARRRWTLRKGALSWVCCQRVLSEPESIASCNPTTRHRTRWPAPADASDGRGHLPSSRTASFYSGSTTRAARSAADSSRSFFY